MVTSNLSLRKLFLRSFIYGLLTCIIALLIRQSLLTDEIRYTSNWTFFLLLLILSFGAFVYFRKFSANFTSIGQLFQASIIFGIAVGIAFGLFYYINVTIVDTDYLQKALDTYYKTWADKGYSKEAIAAQVELTDTFQNPIRWSLVLTQFHFLLTTGLAFIAGCITHKSLLAKWAELQFIKLNK